MTDTRYERRDASRLRKIFCVALVLFSLFTFRFAFAQPHVAVMLPLAGTRAQGNDFTQFYQGFLLGLEQIRLQGGSTRVTVWDTGGDAGKVFNTVVGEDFRDVNLMIGPVYEREMEYAIQFAELTGVPIVSPLATLREADSELLWQMAPDPATKYDKLRELWSAPEPAFALSSSEFGVVESAWEAKNIVVVSSAAGDDEEFAREMEAELWGMDVRRFTIDDRVGAVRGEIDAGSGIAALIDWERENVFVVLGAGELAVDDALATISSSYSNASARLDRTAEVKVIGSSRWAQYNRIDRNLYFKLGVRFVTSYYMDRSRADVRAFDERFLTAYGLVPTRAAWRGWDAAVIFVGALMADGWSFDDRLATALNGAPTGVAYAFGSQDGYRRRVNREWQLVEFSDDFNVTVR